MDLTKLKKRFFYQRRDDMSPHDKLSILIEPNGDAIVTIWEEGKFGPRSFKTIGFCSLGAGGGKSPHTRKALFQLALAMEKDNQENPIK